MYISDMRVTKRGRFSIYVDGEFYCVLHAEIVALCGFGTGDDVPQERLEELRAHSANKMARERAMNLLSARSYTAKGLYDKLETCTDAISAAEAVARMEELGLIDDADYARRYAADCLNLKSYSLRRISQTLRQKGIDRHIIDEVLAEFEVDPEPAIAAIVLRRHLCFMEDEKRTTKAVNALVRLGYSYGDIRNVLRNLEEDLQYYDEENMADF